MLKSVTVGKKQVPVPVPINNMEDCLGWLESTFVRDSGGIITSMELDGKKILWDDPKDKLSKIKLSGKSKLSIKIDSPMELSIQVLEAIGDLSLAIEKDIKVIAYHFWKDESVKDELKHLQQVLSDVVMFLNLINHLNGIIEKKQVQMAPINGLKGLINRVTDDIEAKIADKDYKHAARILLGRLEPLLKEMIVECDNLQMFILTSQINQQCEILEVR